jgi:hypothetical protein
MSKLFRSVLIIAALVGAASTTASAGSYDYGHGKHYGKYYSKHYNKYYGKKHHDTLAFFDWLQRNGK